MGSSIIFYHSTFYFLKTSKEPHHEDMIPDITVKNASLCYGAGAVLAAVGSVSEFLETRIKMQHFVCAPICIAEYSSDYFTNSK